MCFLEQGDFKDFSPSRRSVLPIVFLVTMVPAALRSLTRSSRVVLGWFLTVLVRWELAWSPRPREIDSYFVFLPLANNRTNCCHLLIKLLGDGLAAHSRLVIGLQSFLDILGQLFGLGHGGEFGIWLIDCFCVWTGVFVTSNELGLGAIPLNLSTLPL